MYSRSNTHIRQAGAVLVKDAGQSIEVSLKGGSKDEKEL